MLKLLELSDAILTSDCYDLYIESIGILPHLYKYYQETGKMVLFLQRSLAESSGYEVQKLRDNKLIERALQQGGLFSELITTNDDDSVTSADNTYLYAVSSCMPSFDLSSDDFLREYQQFAKTTGEVLYMFLGDTKPFRIDMSIGAFVTFLSKTFKTEALDLALVPLNVTLEPLSCTLVRSKTNYIDLCRQYIPYVYATFVSEVKQGRPMDAIAWSWYGNWGSCRLSGAGLNTFKNKKSEHEKLWVLINDATRNLASKAERVLSDYLKRYDFELEFPLAK